MTKLDLVMRDSTHIGHMYYDQSCGYLCDNETDEIVIFLQETFNGVSSGIVQYRNAQNYENQNCHLNLVGGKSWEEMRNNPQIYASIEGDHLFVKYMRLCGSSYNRSCKWATRRYKYK